jgi:DNA-binding transcriptional ArsR family regulator
MRQTKLSLSPEDRAIIDEIKNKSIHQSRETTRAYILSSLDRGVSESSLMEVLEVSRSTIYRTRKAYLDKGLVTALYDESRSGKPIQYGEDVMALITALACSAPPPGFSQWTVRLLTEEAKKNRKIGTISRETVRRALKKTP